MGREYGEGLNKREGFKKSKLVIYKLTEKAV
jgi:hypothetical protein